MTDFLLELQLSDGFLIKSKQHKNSIQIHMLFNDEIIANAILITDFVDTMCITSMTCNESYANRIFPDGHTLGDAFIKFLIKYPSLVRKLEFRFILDVPNALKSAIEKYHFESKTDNTILVRQVNEIPLFDKPENISLRTSITEEYLPDLLALLQSNAYWQAHLTMERLRLLVKNSNCIFAFKENELVGFSRVMTDGIKFASLWDVVVAENYRKQKIATTMMHHIFSDSVYCAIASWVLFTDTAETLYQKFGFRKETDITIRATPSHKLRLQSEHPINMGDMIAYTASFPIKLTLNSRQSHTYLFETKRGHLLSFWQEQCDTDRYVSAYLKLLKLERKPPSLAYLRELQKAHIETIPHENINGFYNIPGQFEIKSLLKKYIQENRGGMCFELNYSFGWLLHHLGFNLELKLSWVHAYNEAQENNPYPTHPMLIVYLNEQYYLTDVGWSDSYRYPITLNGDIYEDVGGTGNYRVIPKDEKAYVMQKQIISHETSLCSWVDQFSFPYPTSSLKSFHYPPGFLAAYAYTCVGKQYIFSHLFKFTKVQDNGHEIIWGDRLLVRQRHTKASSLLEESIPEILRRKFQVTPNIASKCTKIERTTSWDGLSIFHHRKSFDVLTDDLTSHISKSLH